MSQRARPERCARCAKKSSPESCWYCSAELCADCFYDIGHCGHLAAYVIKIEECLDSRKLNLEEARHQVKKLREGVK